MSIKVSESKSRHSSGCEHLVLNNILGQYYHLCDDSDEDNLDADSSDAANLEEDDSDNPDEEW